MSDQALKNAMAKRNELAASINNAQHQIDEWKRELARVDGFIEAWHAFAKGSVELPALQAAGTAHFEPPKKRRTTGNTPKEQVAEAARELSTERGEPIGRGELYKLLTDERGLTIEGSDPEMVLSTMLWRMRDKVVHIRGHGYWPAERPYEPAGYDPELDDFLGVADYEEPVASD